MKGKESFDCPHCGQDLRLSPGAGDEIELAYEKGVTDERKRMLEQVQPLVEALKTIACSAPCKEHHESFNSPGQPCDQRIASEALSHWDRIQKGESV